MKVSRPWVGLALLLSQSRDMQACEPILLLFCNSQGWTSKDNVRIYSYVIAVNSVVPVLYNPLIGVWMSSSTLGPGNIEFGVSLTGDDGELTSLAHIGLLSMTIT